jgi:hypothetical protein
MAVASDMNTSRSNATAGARFGEFWRWWRGEIVRMLPQRFAAFGGGASTPLVLVDGDEVIVIDPHAPQGAEKRANLAGLDEGGKRALCAQLESAGETRGRARRVAPPRGLVRRVTLPAATEENLAQVLGFEMDRLTPFKADEVYFDQRVVSRDAADGQITVELAMAPRERVDARVRELGALGVSVQGVALRDDAHRSPDTFDLLPSEQRGERESSRERAVRTSLIGAVALLFIAALAFPVAETRGGEGPAASCGQGKCRRAGPLRRYCASSGARPATTTSPHAQVHVVSHRTIRRGALACAARHHVAAAARHQDHGQDQRSGDHGRDGFVVEADRTRARRCCRTRRRAD